MDSAARKKSGGLMDLVILIKGAGEQATGVAHRLFRSRFKVCMTERPNPKAVRRHVSFCEAVWDGEKVVEGVVAKRIEDKEEVFGVWGKGGIPVVVDPEAMLIDYLKPDVVVDAVMAKRSTGLTKITDAPLVIGLGPGFCAGKDVHLVIETNRGHNLGRVINRGEAETFTGTPGVIGGFAAERVLRAPCPGCFAAHKDIGDEVQAGEMVGEVAGLAVKAEIGGILRGLVRDGLEVGKRQKLGDVDPRGDRDACYTISDKARAIAGGVLEGILMHFNR